MGHRLRFVLRYSSLIRESGFGFRRSAPSLPLDPAARPHYPFPPMSSSWPAAVLFDFDGVIFNSEPLHFWSFHEVLRSEKIEISEAEYYQELIGFDDKGAFKHIFQKHGRELDPKTF